MPSTSLIWSNVVGAKNDAILFGDKRLFVEIRSTCPRRANSGHPDEFTKGQLQRNGFDWRDIGLPPLRLHNYYECLAKQTRCRTVPRATLI